MKKIISTLLAALAVSIVINACQNSTHSKQETVIVKDGTVAIIPKGIKEKVLTAEEQKALTPDAVIQSLKDGNRRYINNDLTE